MTESVGKCSQFNAEPGYGLKCSVSNIQDMLTTMDKKEKKQDEKIIESAAGKCNVVQGESKKVQ